MKQECYQALAKQLLAYRAPGANHLRISSDIRPDSLDDALFVHQEMIRLSAGVGAWKCLLPPNDEHIVVAPIFSVDVFSGETCTMIEDNGKARIEPEIAFILANDLPACDQGYTEEQINQSLGSAHLVLELIQMRFDEQSGVNFYEKLADCLCNQGIYIGPQINMGVACEASEVAIRVEQDDNAQIFSGRHPNQFPRKAISWLINFMTKRGQDFYAGQALTTGSYCGVVDVEFGKKTMITFEGIGQYQVTFSRQ